MDQEKTYKWGYVWETEEIAQKAGKDKHTNIRRTGLEKYLEVIFPNAQWIHDKAFKVNGKNYRIRPDYRSDEMRIIVECDGKVHYSDPRNIVRDERNTAIYEGAGYQVVRIPYFIQLTNRVVKQIFGADVKEELFPEGIGSMSIIEENTPAFMCPAGVRRMAEEFLKYPEQYKANIESLQNEQNDALTGLSYLEQEISRLK